MNEEALLREGKIGVMPTDTLYGLVASALNEEAVRRVYEVKGRQPDKPCIILIPSLESLSLFGIARTDTLNRIFSQYWPGPVSIIVPCGPAVSEELHRGIHTLAFRLPNDPDLISFLSESGPLIAPSCNPEGLPVATTGEEARAYFGDSVDFYIDGGIRTGEPSTLIEIDSNNEVKVLRQGRDV